jgi:hypothetical protein
MAEGDPVVFVVDPIENDRNVGSSDTHEAFGTGEGKSSEAREGKLQDERPVRGTGYWRAP